MSVTGSAGGASAAKGGGRVVPVKEGVLHKRCGKSGSALSRETWKKKYVVLLPDGRIIYHPNMHDYLDGEHGKVSVYLFASTLQNAIPCSLWVFVALYLSTIY